MHDLDDCKEGFTTFNNNAEHTPISGSYGLCLCYNYANVWLWQIAMLTGNAKVYTRRSINGNAWTDWVEV